MEKETLSIRNIKSDVPYSITNNNNGTFSTIYDSLLIKGVRTSSIKQIIDLHDAYITQLKKIIKASKTCSYDRLFTRYCDYSKYNGRTIRVKSIESDSLYYGKLFVNSSKKAYILTNETRLDGALVSIHDRSGFFYSWYIDGNIEYIDVLNIDEYFDMSNESLDLTEDLKPYINYGIRLNNIGVSIGCNQFKIDDVKDLYSKLTKDDYLTDIYADLKEFERKLNGLMEKISSAINSKSNSVVTTPTGRDSRGRFIKKT